MKNLKTTLLAMGVIVTLLAAACDNNATKPATAIAISGENAQHELSVSQTLKLTATLTPSDSTDDIAWASSDSAVATVSGTGTACTVTAVSVGSTTITASAGSVSATYAITVTRTKVAITAIGVTPEAKNVTVGSTLQLAAIITPSDASDPSVTWSIAEGADFASVSSVGLVTAKAVGVAKVQATSVDNPAISATSVITVTAMSIPATSVTITSAATEVRVGATVTLTATIMPANSTDALKWSVTGAEGIVTVDETSGVVTGVKAGATEITATAGNQTAKVTITVPAVYSVSFSLNYAGATDAPETQIIVGSGKAEKPADPTRAGYVFAGWLNADDVAWDFDNTVSTNVSLHAKWLSTDATLASLKINGAALTLGTAVDIAAADVASTITSVTVAATASDPGATVTGTGTANVAAGKNVITLTVTAQDGTTKKTYTITVYRRQLSISAPVDAVSVGADIDVTGAWQAGAAPTAIDVSLAGLANASATVAADGTWGAKLSATAVPNGSASLSVRVTWAGGATETISRNLTVSGSAASTRSIGGTLTLTGNTGTAYVAVYVQVPGTIAPGPKVIVEMAGASASYTLAGVAQSAAYTLSAYRCDASGAKVTGYSEPTIDIPVSSANLTGQDLTLVRATGTVLVNAN